MTQNPLCTGLTDLFFSDDEQDIEQAQALCDQCPLQSPCLQGALQRREAAGVWGGLLFRAGRKPVRTRGRPGRPAAIAS